MLKTWCRLLVLMMPLILSAACRTAPKGDTAAANIPQVKPLVLWVDWQGSAETLSSPDAAAQFVANARRSGVTHLALEVVDSSGAPIREGSSLYVPYSHVKRAAAAAGIKLAAAVPLFLAPPDADTVRLEYRARWNGEAYELTRELAAGDAPSRYSIFDDAAQQQQLFLIDAVLQDPAFSLIIISGLGFTDSLSDLGPTGRREFEGLVGVDLRSWPESIIGEKPTDTPFGPYGRGALWNAWTTWRAMVLHKFLLRIRERMALSPNSPMLAVLADSPYPAHQRQGLNWASAGSPALAENPWLPADYEMTAAGHLLDVLVLGFWQPGLLTSEQTEREGYAWWSSVEGATAAARRYRAPGSEQWAAVPVSPETPWATTARLAGELNDGLMLFSASNFLGDPEAWQLLSLSRPQ